MKLRNLWHYTRVYSGLLAFLVMAGLAIAAVWLLVHDSLLPAVVVSAIILLVLVLSRSSLKWMQSIGSCSLNLRRARYVEAEQHCLRARAVAEHFGEHDPRRAIGLHLLGEVYLAQARFDEAEELTRQSLALRERIWGPDHRQVVHSCVGLANIYMCQARFAEAEELLLRSLRLTETNLGPNHTDTAICNNNLGKVYGDQRRHAQAEEYYRRTLAIFEKMRNREFRGIALNNVAYACICQGKTDEAETLCRQASSLLGESLPTGHPYRTYTLNTLARVMFQKKEFRQAEDMARRVLVVREQSMGQHHPLVAHALDTLAAICMEEGKHDEAEGHYRRALAIRSATTVPNHPDVIEKVNNYARLLNLRGRSAEAEAL